MMLKKIPAILSLAVMCMAAGWVHAKIPQNSWEAWALGAQTTPRTVAAAAIMASQIYRGDGGYTDAGPVVTSVNPLPGKACVLLKADVDNTAGVCVGKVDVSNATTPWRPCWLLDPGESLGIAVSAGETYIRSISGEQIVYALLYEGC